MKYQRLLTKLLLKKIVILHKMHEIFKSINIITSQLILGLDYFLLTA